MDRERRIGRHLVTSSVALTQAAEELPQVADQVVRPLHRRKVPARGELRPVLDAMLGIDEEPDDRVRAEHREPIDAGPGSDHSCACMLS